MQKKFLEHYCVAAEAVDDNISYYLHMYKKCHPVTSIRGREVKTTVSTVATNNSQISFVGQVLHSEGEGEMTA
jgi:hypothetical protein